MAHSDKINWDAKYTSNPLLSPPSPLLVEYAELALGKRALDIACGMGRNSRYLASLGFEVDAFDISSVAIQSLQNIPHIHPKEVDFDHCKIPKNRYNLIVCTNFLMRELFEGMTEALTDDGILFIETFCHHPQNQNTPANPLFLLRQGELEASFSHRLEILHLHEFWDEDLKGKRAFKNAMIAKKVKRNGCGNPKPAETAAT
jgi:SAM-dependent methyltransferase